MLDHKVGTRRNRILEDRRTLGVAHALDIEQVLDRYRHAREQAALASRLLHQGFRMRSRAIKTQDRQRVDLAVDRGDSLFQHVEQIERGDFARIEFFHDRACRFANQTLISHVRFSPCRFLVADGVVV